LAMKAHSQPEMREAMAQAEAIMRSRRHLRPRAPDDFTLETADEMLDFWGKISRVLFVALPGLVAASLVVGGLDIMNFVLLGVALGTGVGILAGVYPASRAARLDPIAALRHET